nr:HNH endonuclease signature motif containing protein [Aureibacillus halotolerans]
MQKPLKPCNEMTCNQLTRNRYCEAHTHIKPDYEQHRGTAHQRGYNTRWRKARQAYLAAHPVCVECKRMANVVDHITPHKGDDDLFWDQGNWQAMCTSCHNSKTAREDMGSWQSRL